MRNVNLIRSVVTLTALAATWVGQTAFGQCPTPTNFTVCSPPAAIVCPDDVTGDFCSAEAPFLAPNGPGVSLSGAQIQIDQTCDGDFADPADLTFDLPATNASDPGQVLNSCTGCSYELRLSPSQDALYFRVFNDGGAVPGCPSGKVRVWFYHFGAPPTLIPFTGTDQGACMDSVAIGPVFHDEPGNPVRTGVVVADPVLQGSIFIQEVMWADLVGGAVNIDSISYFDQVQWPQFSQEGDAAFIVSLDGPDVAAYVVVDLCRDPLGASISRRMPPTGRTGFSAQITGTTGSYFAEISHNAGTDTPIALNDCLCGTPPTDGACCEAAGCSVTDAASCAGTFLPGSVCAPDPCLQACCLPNGSCSDLAPDECTSPANGGTPQGAGTDCSTTTCIPVTEACCVPSSGMCVDVEPGLCTTSGGNPAGPGTDCATLSPLCPLPPGVEACCFTSGVCLNMSVASCVGFAGGTPGGAGSNCAAPGYSCPTASLSISKVGPSTAAEGQLITYTITYGNAGPNDSTSVVVSEAIPTGATFVSGTSTPGGAAPVLAGSMLTWAVGSLPVGVTESVDFTVRAGCGSASGTIVNSSYSIAGTPGGAVSGAPVTTTLSASSSAPISIAVSSTDLNGGALQSGDLLEHIITLTNTVAELREGITVMNRFAGDIDAGWVSEFDAVVNAAGGTFTVDPGNVAFKWEGPIAPSATIDLVFTTRVIDCIPSNQTEEVLNRGRDIAVENGCGVELGYTTPTDRFPLERPVKAELTAVNLFVSEGAAAARAGSTIEFEMRLVEQYGASWPNVSASLTIPSGITPDPAVDPLVNPPASVTYDAATRRITYTGPVGPLETIAIRWNGILDVDAPCQVNLTFSGSLPGCANLLAKLRIFKIPVLPTNPFLIGLGPMAGLWLIEPGLPDTYESLLCISGEMLTGTTQTPAGELWITGVTQVIRFDPVSEPPQVEFFREAFLLNELNINNPWDVAFDPTTPQPSYVIVGNDGTSSFGSVRRYTPSEPAGQRIEVILDDPALTTFDRVNIDPEGMIATIGKGQLVRIDPTGPLPLTPGDYEQFDIEVNSTFGGLPGARSPAAAINLTLDKDGDYLVTVATTFFEDYGNPLALPFRFTTAYSLLKIDRTSGTVGSPTGTPNVLVELLAGSVSCQGTCPVVPPPADFSGAMFPVIPLTHFGTFHGLIVDPNCEILFGSDSINSVWAADPTGPTGHIIWTGGRGADLEYANVAPGGLGDFDFDCDVDDIDYAQFLDCMAGPDLPPDPTPFVEPQDCLDAFDSDGDVDVDADDLAAFQTVYTGS